MIVAPAVVVVRVDVDQVRRELLRGAHRIVAAHHVGVPDVEERADAGVVDLGEHLEDVGRAANQRVVLTLECDADTVGLGVLGARMQPLARVAPGLARRHVLDDGAPVIDWTRDTRLAPGPRSA